MKCSSTTRFEVPLKTRDVLWGLAGGGMLAALLAVFFLKTPQPEQPRSAVPAVSPKPVVDNVVPAPTQPAAALASSADADAETTTATVRPVPRTNDSPRSILERLSTLKIARDQPQGARQLLIALERLKESGPTALPEIRAFLQTGEDVDYDGWAGRSVRVPTEFMVPPSLRLGLLEVVKNIGGPAAEQLLVHELRTTGRGVEVAYLAGVLEQIAPGRHGGTTVAAVHELLAMPLSTRAPNRLDRGDREFLFGVLREANDRSYLGQAQTQLLRPDGQLDRDALGYLQHTLGEGAVEVAAKAWQDPRLTARQKEPLARAALPYVGANAQAGELFQAAINDPAMSSGQRRELIEDLNEAGLPARHRVTPANLPLIDSRIALIDRLAASTQDQNNLRAFAEAERDLMRLREGIVGPQTKKK